MNNYRVQQELRKSLEGMKDKQLSQVEVQAVKLKHRETGQSFCELAAARLAAGVTLNPDDVVRVIRIAPRFPGLAKELLKHFPDEAKLKDIAEGRGQPVTPRNADDYLGELCDLRDDLEGKLDALRAATDEAACVKKLQVSAIQSAAWVGDMVRSGYSSPKQHLREERIDALASLLCLFANPDTACPDPVETRLETMLWLLANPDAVTAEPAVL